MNQGEPLGTQVLQRHPLPPVIDGDKRSKGRVLVIAGSRDVPGAALLAATGAMRAGAGKLRIGTVEGVAVPLALAMPEAMVVGLVQADDGGFADGAEQSIGELAADADAIVAGPGVKRNGSCRAICTTLLECSAALALDVAFLECLEPPGRERSPMPLLLPDSSELAALLDCDRHAIADDPIGCGRRAAERFRSIVLVKGPVSHVVTPDGQCWTYNGGAPGLGVSGSGDVLAGIVSGLLARGAAPLNALLWAVWLHGEAGAKLARSVGPIGFLARDIPGEIPGLLPR